MLGDYSIGDLFTFGGAELLGTFLLLLLGNGVVATVVLNKTKGTGAGWVAITLGWFLGVFIGVFVSSSIVENYIDKGSDLPRGFINPVFSIIETIKGFKTGNFPAGFGIIALIAQMLGAMIGSATVVLMYKNHYNETQEAGKILATFSTGPAIRDLKNNFIVEVIATFVLVIAVGYISSAASGIGGAFTVGWVIMAIGISLGSITGYSLNPARDLGPRIVHQLLTLKGKGDSDWSYAWVASLGPITGGLIGMLVTPGLLF